MRGAMNDDKKVQDAKAEAERLIEDLFGLATLSLERGNLSQDDDLLVWGRLFLATGSRELMEIVDKSNSGAPGYEAIARTIRGAALIGSTAIFTKKYFLARQKALRARAAKQTMDDNRIQELDDAIVAEATHLKEEFAYSIEFAGTLRPGVRKRLGLPREGEGWPSPGTIKLAISTRIKPAKTNRTNLTSAKSAKTNRVSR
jgi:hypothetical protein